MKGLVFDPAKTDVEIRELKKPEPQKGEVLIKVEIAGICGSDIVAWKGGFPRIEGPVVLGHEAAGIIEAMGDGCHLGFGVGDRVVIEPLDSCGQCDACKKGHYNVCDQLKVYGIDRDGFFAEYVSVREDRLHHISKQMSSQRCAMCECVSVGVHVVRRSQLQYGDTVLISGAGTIGILVGLLALRSGAGKVVITDMNTYRLSIAAEMGMCPVNIKKPDAEAQMWKELGGKKADVAFEIVGVADSLNLCLQMTKSRGTVIIVGMFKDIPATTISAAVLKELKVEGSRVYTYDDFDKAAKLLEDTDFPIEQIISEVVDFDCMIEKGMKPIKNGAELLKVLVKF